MILEYAIPYVKTGGYFVAYKSIKAELNETNNKILLLSKKKGGRK